MFSPEIQTLAEKIIAAFKAEQIKLVAAESCTGGLVAACLTGVSGASAVVERGFVTYSNDAKVEVLGVMPEFLDRYGAVSVQVAEEMAKGALDFSHADVSVSITGVAGPEGGTEKKPVGLVCFGLATRNGSLMHYKCKFSGDREEVRMQAVTEALKLFLTVVDQDY